MALGTSKRTLALAAMLLACGAAQAQSDECSLDGCLTPAYSEVNFRECLFILAYTENTTIVWPEDYENFENSRWCAAVLPPIPPHAYDL